MLCRESVANRAAASLTPEARPSRDPRDLEEDLGDFAFSRETVEFLERRLVISGRPVVEETLEEPLTAMVDITSTPSLEKGPAKAKLDQGTAELYKRVTLQGASHFPGHVVLKICRDGGAKYHLYDRQGEQHHVIHAAFPQCDPRSVTDVNDLCGQIADVFKSVLEEFCQSPCDQLRLPRVGDANCPSRFRPELPDVTITGLALAFTSLLPAERDHIMKVMFRLYLCTGEEAEKQDYAVAKGRIVDNIAAATNTSRSCAREASSFEQRRSVQHCERVLDWSSAYTYFQAAEEAKRRALEDASEMEGSHDDTGVDAGTEVISESAVGGAGRSYRESFGDEDTKMWLHRDFGALGAADGQSQRHLPTPLRHEAGRSALKRVTLDTQSESSLRSIKWRFSDRGAVVKELGRNFLTATSGAVDRVMIDDVLVHLNGQLVLECRGPEINKLWREAQDQCNNIVLELQSPGTLPQRS